MESKGRGLRAADKPLILRLRPLSFDGQNTRKDADKGCFEADQEVKKWSWGLQRLTVEGFGLQQG